MKRADDLSARVATLFPPLKGETARFKIAPGPDEVIVEETQKEGAARIVCLVPEGFVAIPWRLQSGDLRPIGSEKNADGAMLLLRPDGGIEAHVMECKQTITSTKWKDVLEQLDLEWIRSDVSLPGWASGFPHVKVQKDERGHATVGLRVDE